MRGKDVLTAREKEQIKHNGKIPMSPLEYKEIEAKLKRYQGSITNRMHIQQVNKYIPQAESMAMTKGLDGEMKFSARYFCRAMNRLTRAAGLRG